MGETLAEGGHGADRVSRRARGSGDDTRRGYLLVSRVPSASIVSQNIFS